MTNTYNQQKDAPLAHYRDKYREIDPIEAAKRTGLAFDAANNCFEINTLNHRVFAQWPDFNLIPNDEKSCPKTLYGFSMKIITVRYIIEGVDIASTGEFKAYRELPWGDVYDSNFQGRCIKRFAYSFGTKLDSFRKAAELLGGVKLKAGDASFDLPFFGNVVCRLILWAPDEEFPPSAQFLFSDNTQFAFNAEDLAAVGDIVIGALKEVSKGTEAA